MPTAYRYPLSKDSESRSPYPARLNINANDQRPARANAPSVRKHQAGQVTAPLAELMTAGFGPVASALTYSPDAEAMFVGPKTLPWTKIAIDAAKDMAGKGLDPRKIWQETGRRFGAPVLQTPWDNQWMAEISDHAASLPKGTEHYGALGQVLLHPKLDMYNTDVPISLVQVPTQVSVRRGVTRHGEYYPKADGQRERINVQAGTKDEALNSLLHETQHKVQNIEGFSPGFSGKRAKAMLANEAAAPDEIQVLISELRDKGATPAEIADELYRSSGGEIMARLTAARRTMKPEERALSYPLDDYVESVRIPNAWNPAEGATEFAKGGSVEPSKITSGSVKYGLTKDSAPLSRLRELYAQQQASGDRKNSVMSQQGEEGWKPDYERQGGHALEAPMISPDDLIGTGIPSKVAQLAALAGKAGMSKFAPLAMAGVIKEKGGNWLSGSVEGALSGLKKTDFGAGTGVLPNTPDAALNNWIDKPLTRYVKNEMATPQDPIRALAERGVLHVTPPAGFDSSLVRARKEAGFPEMGMANTPLAQSWEGVSDKAIRSNPASTYQNFGSSNLGEDWINKLDPNTPFYQASAHRDANSTLGFDHLIDELSNAINPESGLPRHLQFPADRLDKVSVPQAVERVAAINEWRAAQKAEADAMKANNAATHLHKEYPDQTHGLSWKQIKTPVRTLETLSPEERVVYESYLADKYPTERALAEATERSSRKALEDALKYEGDTMGHCVGGYCEDVASGKSKIYSLRDAKGQPHVTVEVEPGEKRSFKLERDYERLTPEERALADAYDGPLKHNYPDQAGIITPERLQELYDASAAPSRILQIKGKGNRAPNPEYLPMVQDFVKSGKWSDVGDLANTGLQRAGWAADTLEQLQKHGIPAPEYGTADEINAAINALNKAKGFAQGGSVQPKNLTDSDFQAIIALITQGTSHA